jgi:hypothetical protein
MPPAAGASGMTLVCRPTPFVRFMHRSELTLKATSVSHGTQNVGTLLLLPSGTIYRRTPKQYSVVRVQKNYFSLLFVQEKSGSAVHVLPAGSAAFIPRREHRGLSPRFGKAFQCRAKEIVGRDLLLCSAKLGHNRLLLLRRLVEQLRSGGILAFQEPT